jgi:hypothetical protein
VADYLGDVRPPFQDQSSMAHWSLIGTTFTNRSFASSSLILIVPLLFLLACTSKEDPAFSVNALANASYFKFKNERSGVKVTLKSGHCEGVDTLDTGIANGYAMDLDTSHIAIGELSGDGRNCAVVFLSEWGGGTAILVSLNVIADSNGTPSHLAELELGDHVEIDSVFIRDRIIRVNALIRCYLQEPGPPDSSLTWSFRLEGHALQQVSSTK